MTAPSPLKGIDESLEGLRLVLAILNGEPVNADITANAFIGLSLMFINVLRAQAKQLGITDQAGQDAYARDVLEKAQDGITGLAVRAFRQELGDIDG